MSQAHRVAKEESQATGERYHTCLGRAISSLYAGIKSTFENAKKIVERFARLGVSKTIAEVSGANGKFFYHNQATYIINKMPHVIKAEEEAAKGAAEYYSKNAVTMC